MTTSTVLHLTRDSGRAMLGGNPEITEQPINGNTPRVDCRPVVPRGAALQKVVSRDSTREAFAYCHVTRTAVSGQRPGRVIRTQECVGASVSTEFMKRSLEELTQLALPTRGEPIRAIYYLFKDGRVIYVGSSANAGQRVQQHILAREKDFDAFHIEPVTDPEASLVTLEAQEILRFQPELNRTLPSNNLYINARALKIAHRIGKLELNKLERQGKLPTTRFKDGAWYLRSDIARIFNLPQVLA